MSRRAWAYIWAVLIAAVSISGLTLRDGMPSSPFSTSEWLTFLAFTVLATLAQLFKAEAPNHQTYFATPVFLFAGVVTLHPLLFILLVITSYLIEWIKERLVKSPQLRNWYLQPFNISTHIVAGLAAHVVQTMILNEGSQAPTWFPSLLQVASVLAAAITYAAVNHILVGMALVLARRISWRESGVLETENLLTELILLLIGYTVAVLWALDPWLILPALSPLILIYRALTIPQLKKEAQTDEKTGLWNARHFATLYSNELERAKRFDRPMALLMADLDLLRNINNTYGHLAGDVVLTGIGKIIRETIREYDIAGRFGGEEFAIVLPEVEPEEAKQLAERIRQAIELGSFEVTTSMVPIHATMSIGISCFPQDGATAKELLHEADIAVYQAKLNGRNCVVCTTDMPHSLELSNTVGLVDRLASPYNGTFVPRAKPGEDEKSAPSTYSTANNTGSLKATIITGNLTEAMITGQLSPQMVTGTLKPSDVPTAQITPPVPTQSKPIPQNTHAASTTNSSADIKSRVSALSSAIADPSNNKPTPQISDAGSANPEPKATASAASKMLKVFVSSVIIASAVLTIVRFTLRPDIDLTAIALLSMLAIVAELLQVDLYGPGTVSVSVAVTFAAALIAGVPGAACASAAIALVHYYRRRPAPYQTMFNWAVHVLAAVPPVMVTNGFGLELRIDNLHILAIPVLLSALVYYIVDTGLIATVITLANGEGNIVATWVERYRWLVNHYLVLCVMGFFLGIAYTSQGAIGMLVFTLPILMMHYTQRQYVERTEDSVRELQRMNRELTRANTEVVAASRAMRQLNEELFLTLSKIIDARDPWVSSHASQVADYAVAIGIELGMEPERLDPLRQAGFLHDIGKIGISEQVLHKPDKLTDEEYEYIKTHAALGSEFLEMVTGLRHLAPFVRHHHERWDGRGYPDNLSQDDIELEARILAVCDSAEAMASDRPYRKGMSLAEIIAEVTRCSGTQFDPEVAAAFIRVAEREREKLLFNSGQAMLRKHADNNYLMLRDKGLKNGNGTEASSHDQRDTGVLTAV